MNPIMSTLAQIIILMPANFALRLLDRAAPLAAGDLKTRSRRGDMLLASMFVTGWWCAIVMIVKGVTGLP
ncbi:hypothetical protein D0B54_06250 [Solimonas sp. K1W22B-7]|uniref:hypothetical protein n=1 Tax=Solimonas sp. K1W22B-7 TaxID=2303331 RepID=UPI000E32E68B|nr:hypothetical protein [Solimonas sp. K1W22B-7]AXQ28307.1 hypothetical protein D0B54_06250 [Solimonas sp. K1W22B-7]